MINDSYWIWLNTWITWCFTCISSVHVINLWRDPTGFFSPYHPSAAWPTGCSATLSSTAAELQNLKGQTQNKALLWSCFAWELWELIEISFEISWIIRSSWSFGLHQLQHDKLPEICQFHLLSCPNGTISLHGLAHNSGVTFCKENQCFKSFILNHLDMRSRLMSMTVQRSLYRTFEIAIWAKRNSAKIQQIENFVNVWSVQIGAAVSGGEVWSNLPQFQKPLTAIWLDQGTVGSGTLSGEWTGDRT